MGMGRREKILQHSAHRTPFPRSFWPPTGATAQRYRGFSASDPSSSKLLAPAGLQHNTIEDSAPRTPFPRSICASELRGISLRIGGFRRRFLEGFRGLPGHGATPNTNRGVHAPFSRRFSGVAGIWNDPFR
jgi:hypothetical protein